MAAGLKTAAISGGLWAAMVFLGGALGRAEGVESPGSARRQEWSSSGSQGWLPRLWSSSSRHGVGVGRSCGGLGCRRLLAPRPRGHPLAGPPQLGQGRGADAASGGGLSVQPRLRTRGEGWAARAKGRQLRHPQAGGRRRAGWAPKSSDAVPTRPRTGAATHADVARVRVTRWACLSCDSCLLGWGKDELRFYVDGVLVRSVENTHWHQPLLLTFDSETMPEWMGMPKDEDLPSTFSVEYVRAWKKE